MSDLLEFGGLGIPVIETPYAVASEEVSRTWRERLFSRPWRPWVKTKFVDKPAIYILSPSLYGGGYGVWSPSVPQDVIVAHPTLAAQIRNLGGGGEDTAGVFEVVGDGVSGG